MSVAAVIDSVLVRLALLGAGVVVGVLVLWLCGPARLLNVVTWRVVSVSNSTVPPGTQHTFYIDLTNVGDTETDGSPVTLTITLPDGMTGVSADVRNTGGLDCPSVAGERIIVCAGTPSFAAAIKKTLTLTVDVAMGTPELLTSAFAIDGGGAPLAQTVDPVRVSSVTPAFGIDAFDVAATKDGLALTQAGGHPDSLTTSIDFYTRRHPNPSMGDVAPVEDAKNVTVEIPPGLVGNPAGVDECTQPQLENGGLDPRPLCPSSSQIGVVLARLNQGVLGPVPLFNMAPPPGVPAQFGFNVAGTIVVLNAHVRSDGDYGLGVTASNIPQGLAITGNTVTLWGVPADESHDAERACAGLVSPANGGPTCRSSIRPRVFFRNPTSCTPAGRVTTTVQVESWQQPGVVKTASVAAHDPLGYPFSPFDAPGWGPPLPIDGCERVPFTPVLRAQPLSGAKAASPSGFAFDVTIPQDDRPETLVSQSDLRKATVTLPEGVRVSPSSANGLGACSSVEIALKSRSEPTCPDNSKLGSVTIETPLLDVPVTGNVFLAKPFDNPFNSLIAVYIVASAKGVVIKLPGLAVMDPQTGQISTTFDNNPQLPFSRLHVEFRGGPRAPLTTPRRCGAYTTRAVLTGWSGRTVASDSSFTLTENAKGRPCPPQFSPHFTAGTVSNVAGSSSPFLMRFTREDEDQELSGLTVRMARGLTGKIADVDLCTDAQARANACPSGSQIGRVTVGAGAGSSPFFIESGRAYLTGPYKAVGSSETAPFGASIVVPAVAGPFDLGNVTVRAAVFVDKHDATVRIVSDPFPTILQGIPLDVRDVRVNVDKPGFWLNPTSCAEKRIMARLTSTEGARADVSERFQAVECANLGFKPRMSLRVGGRGHTRRGQTTGFRTTLRMPSRRQTNLRFVRVTLPKTINARLNTINDACTRREFEADISRCGFAKAGTAVASTPLLRRPLRGSVYFVKNGNPIPDLFVALRGQVDFDLIGRISIVNNVRLRTTFATAPDVPIRAFTLRLLGDSKNASIGAAANLCSRASRRHMVEVDYIGQNGKIRQTDQSLKVGGCGKQKSNRSRR